METQTQYQLATYLSVALVALGLVGIGMGIGFYISAQSLLGPSCAGRLFVAEQTATVCEDTAKLMNGNATKSLVVGLAAVGIGRGLLYYLQKQLP